jgi:ubiquinone/menaquinone biosynthesis C-methylase UbiE
MDWTTYKTEVVISRDIIIFPFFEKHLETKSGIGLDIGCGDGDLTNHVAAQSSARFVGIDISQMDLEKARQRSEKNVHYIYGDIEKNAIPTLGVNFDFAFSNCCFSPKYRTKNV